MRVHLHRLNQSPHGEEAPTGPRKARPDDRLRAVSSQWRWNETGVEPGNFPVLQNGAPDTIRTCDLCLRRATLYPAELRVRWGSFSPLAGDRQRAGGSFFGKGHAFESCRVRQEAVCGACRDCGDPLLPRQKSAETAAKESLWSTRPTRRLCFKAVAHLFASLSGRWLRGPWSGESRKFYPDRTDPLLGFGILEPISSNMRSKIKAPVSLIKVDARFSSCFPVSSSPAVPDRIRRSACTIRARHSGTRA